MRKLRNSEIILVVDSIMFHPDQPLRASYASCWASLIIQLIKNPPVIQETLVWFLGWEDPLDKGQAIHASILGLPCGSAGKESVCSVGDHGSIPRLGKSPGEGKSYPLQYSGLESIILDYIVHGVAKSWTQMSDLHLFSLLYLLLLGVLPAIGT